MKLGLNETQLNNVKKYLDVALKKRGVQVAEHITSVVLRVEKDKDLVLEQNDIQRFIAYLDDAIREFGINEAENITYIILRLGQAVKESQQAAVKDDVMIDVPEVPDLVQAAKKTDAGDSRSSDT